MLPGTSTGLADLIAARNLVVLGRGACVLVEGVLELYPHSDTCTFIGMSGRAGVVADLKEILFVLAEERMRWDGVD